MTLQRERRPEEQIRHIDRAFEAWRARVAEGKDTVLTPTESGIAPDISEQSSRYSLGFRAGYLWALEEFTQ